jgi:hypothetical protein
MTRVRVIAHDRFPSPDVGKEGELIDSDVNDLRGGVAVVQFDGGLPQCFLAAELEPLDDAPTLTLVEDES